MVTTCKFCGAAYPINPDLQALWIHDVCPGCAFMEYHTALKLSHRDLYDLLKRLVGHKNLSVSVTDTLSKARVLLGDEDTNNSDNTDAILSANDKAKLELFNLLHTTHEVSSQVQLGFWSGSYYLIFKPDNRYIYKNGCLYRECNMTDVDSGGGYYRTLTEVVDALNAFNAMCKGQ